SPALPRALVVGHFGILALPSNPHIRPHAVGPFFAFKTFLFKPVTNASLGADDLATVLRPIGPTVPKMFDRVALVGSDSAGLIDELLQVVLSSEVVVGRVLHDGRRIQPLALPHQTPIDHPPQDVSERARSRLDFGIVTVNGTSLTRRRIASSTLRNAGLWLPAINSLNCGMYSKKSCRMNRAAIR